jgi:outer membrane protein TolC
MSFGKRFFCVFTLLLSGFFGISFADELDDAIQLALNNSPMAQKFDNILKMERLKNNNTGLFLLPDLSVSFNSFYRNDNPATNFSLAVSIGKSFGDIDNFVQDIIISKNNLNKSEIELEIKKIVFIDQVVDYYTAVYRYQKKIEVEEENIQFLSNVYKALKEKRNKGEELQLNVIRFSNEILLRTGELELDQASLGKNLEYLQYLLGLSNVLETLNFELKFKENEIEAAYFETNSENSLLARDRNINISNNLMSIDKKNRESFLPVLSLSLSASYDILNNNFSYAANLGFAFQIFDIIKKQNEIKIVKLSNEILVTEISNLIKENIYTLFLMKKEIQLLGKRILFLEENGRIAKELQKDYLRRYLKGEIDFIEYYKYWNMSYDDEVRLLQNKVDLYILIKRLKYGVVKLAD